ncbi:UDP-glucose dehydrogenase family protein [Macrococcus lamae]|uniref:UDP-glucose 6-dehydrogenase n=1 Tax=Macrococcus lamae TaxID=198484 RepID=A0A4R6BS67_9STAP|nr:UDP-glucose/GDP-mannose dehydrogenase family protein [Macrococcus lamae]TDM05189.1 UDP-glucose/GDP-mannose dehydrogenase family protein [Macrococcus lamae]
MAKIVVVGTGYVGLVTGIALAEIGNYVHCIDIDENKIRLLNSGVPTIYEENLEDLLLKNLKDKRISFTESYICVEDADFVFITVGTPEDKNGDANLTYIYNAIDEITKYVQNDTVIVMKSTVPLGTNEKIEKYIKNKVKDYTVDVISNPEFLAQGTAINDTLNASRIVLGINDEKIVDKVKKLYEPFNQPILVMNRTSAELVKYASNTFLALKISFINEIANLSDEIGANIKDVTRGMSYDERIGAKFLNAGLGYGGSCFPKDTKALIKAAQRNNSSLLTINSTVDINERQKYKLLDKAKRKGYSLENNTIAILGLSFKPNTDDIREAPSISNIQQLLDKGNKIHVFDPIVNDKVKKLFGDQLEYFKTPQECLKGTDLCFVFTEWKEIKELEEKDFIVNMKRAVVFDGRNCLEFKSNNIAYYGIGI